MKVLALTIILFLLVFLYGCTQSGASQTTGATDADTVRITNYAFNPQTLTISVGTTVTWVNEDLVSHTVSSSTFDSGAIANGQTYTHTFNTAGTYNYQCAIHPSMTGTIIVQ